MAAGLQQTATGVAGTEAAAEIEEQ